MFSQHFSIPNLKDKPLKWALAFLLITFQFIDNVWQKNIFDFLSSYADSTDMSSSDSDNSFQDDTLQSRTSSGCELVTNITIENRKLHYWVCRTTAECFDPDVSLKLDFLMVESNVVSRALPKAFFGDSVSCKNK